MSNNNFKFRTQNVPFCQPGFKTSLVLYLIRKWSNASLNIKNISLGDLVQ